MSERLARYVAIALAAAALAAGLTARVQTDAHAMRFDAGCYAYVAQRTIEDPAAHYLDYFNNKPPGIYALYEGIFRLWGDTGWATADAASRMSALSDALVIVGLFAIGRRFRGTVAGLAAAGAFAALYASVRMSFWGLAESPAAALMVWGAYAYARVVEPGATPNARRGFAVLAGFLLSAAMLQKQASATWMLALGLHLGALAVWRKVAMRDALAWTGWATLGALAAGTPTLLDLLITGRRREFYEYLVVFSVTSHEAFGLGGTGKLAELWPEARTWPVGAVLTALGALHVARRPTSAGLAMLAMLLASCVFFAYFQDFFDHYLIQAYPFAALLAGLAVHAAVTGRSALARVVVLAAFAGFVAHQTVLLRANGYLDGTPRPGTRGYYADFVVGFEDQKRTVDALERVLRPGEPLLTTNPVYAVILGRKNLAPSHYTTPMIVTNEGGDLMSYLEPLGRARVVVVHENGARLLPPAFHERLAAEFREVPEGRTEWARVWVRDRADGARLEE